MRIGGTSGAGGAAGSFATCADTGGQRAVYVSPEGCVGHASASDLDHFERVLGITQHAAAEGDPVAVQWGGEMRDPSFVARFTAEPVWLAKPAP